MNLLRKLGLPTEATALPGRTATMPVPTNHFVNGNPLQEPFPADMARFVGALGCFWGAERVFWQMDGVFTTAVGYAGGITPNPTYEEVCSGATGHAEVVLAVYDPKLVSFEDMLRAFWESHDPTQGMRQGNDIGTQYRSAIYVHSDEQRELAELSKARYEKKLMDAGYSGITTEIHDAGPFYYAEHYHQQYLAKVPNGYCGLGGTGVSCDIEALVAAD
ncbi:MAG: peptide-methionine (S)-S-oxide reductase MsrA [Gammaproteobacteria bacterium]|nr:peptide-methionine (S)-S-oxide reductase MsrA [Gammaproteobacteria bacterium]